jgi:hypothetical protein
MGESDSWGKKNCLASPRGGIGVTHPASGHRCQGRRVYAWSWPVTPRLRLLMNAASAEMPLDPAVDVACGVINL